MRFFLAICTTLLLAGCEVLNPFGSGANLALSSVTYFFTGKTTTDHGISILMKEDCELFRGLDGEICRPPESGYQAVEAEGALMPLSAAEAPAAVLLRRADGTLVVEAGDPLSRQTASLPEDRDISVPLPVPAEVWHGETMIPVSEFFDFR